jgi:two-component system NarL family response regulator
LIAAKLEAGKARGKLTDKERLVLQAIARGRSNKEIAAELEIAEVTVKFYVGRILEKLGVLDRTQAATTALQRGVIHLD